MSVTVLGSDRGVERTAADVVDYLEGKLTARAGQRGAPDPSIGIAAADGGVAGYYADSVEGPGRWLGRGVGSLERAGAVDPAEFEAVLRGEDPATGKTLVAATGSAARAAGRRPRPVEIPGEGPLNVAQAAAVLGVDPSYVRKLAERDDPTAVPDGSRRRASLAGTKVAGEWRFERAVIERFVAQRTPPDAVVGYDVTFSVPKSVSLLWALTDDPAVRGEVIDALDAAVTAGMSYLEEHGAWVNMARTPTVANGLLAASYLHATNRNLEPQLHAHVVVANMAEGPDGRVRALDARGLFLHARTASHLAAAQLRHELTRRLGVEWGPVERGLADISGISDDAIRAFSTRSAEIDALTAELGSDSPAARQAAAYQTRAAKQHPVDIDRLRRHWLDLAADIGLDPDAIDRDVLHRTTGPERVLLARIHDWFAQLGTATGLTEHTATFDRRDVICHVADLARDTLPAEHIVAVADAYLASDSVVALDAAPGERHTIRRRDGMLVPTRAGERLYTTTHMRNLEQWIVDRYEAGLATSSGVVPVRSIDQAIAGIGHDELGPDQAAMVRAICGSGDRIQCVLGPAGSGKTFALAAAARAWTAAGHTVVGASVNGTAAEVLARSTGIASRTVASWLTLLDTADTAVLTRSHVLVVDEASTIGTRDLARLVHHVVRAGATLRLIGDPAQHSAVTAGGMFRYLVDRYPHHTPRLMELRRQHGPEMDDVRLALTDYRNGHITKAWERLERNDRLVTAATPAELLDTLCADWYVDRHHHQAHPDTIKPSSMVAEHHTERRALNTRARALLRADGTLTGPDTTIAGQAFAVGDEIICRAPTCLRPDSAPRGSEVRNGTRGHITDIHIDNGRTELTVDFEHRGPVRVPHEELTRRVRRGVTGILTHAYCLTSHAAQGETYATARMLATDTATRPGVYVGLSRGEHDARLYVVTHDDLTDTIGPDRQPDDTLPRLRSHTAELTATAHRLQVSRTERLAIEHPVATEPELGW